MRAAAVILLLLAGTAPAVRAATPTLPGYSFTTGSTWMKSWAGEQFYDSYGYSRGDLPDAKFRAHEKMAFDATTNSVLIADREN
jgi:hypothetical protein